MSIALPNRGGSGQTDRPWLDLYPKNVPGTLEYPNKPIWWLLEHAGTECPERTAVHYYKQKLSYGELLLKARRAASLFRKRGVKPDDRVGLLLPNTPEYLIAAYGIWMAGGVIVSINPLSARREVADIISSTDCRLVVTLDMLKPLLKGPATPSHILETTIRDRIPTWKRPGYSFVKWRRNGFRSQIPKTVTLSFDREINMAVPIQDPAFRSAEDPAYILPTGGTTGSPKAVVLSHGNLMANAWQLKHWTGQSFGRDSLLAIVPFFHSFGLSSCLTTGIASATTMILFHRFQADRVRQLIERYQPTCFPAVPMMLHELNAEFRKKKSQDQSVRYCISGGAPLPPEIATEFAAHTGALVVEGYGLSEASPVTHVGAMNGTARLGTIGVPLPDTDARIVDREVGNTVLPVGEVGELVVRGPQVMSGYYQDAARSRNAIREGWLFTGDLARQNGDGTFEIVDRKKDLIITSGANVYPAEVEQLLRTFAGIVDAAVIGVPDMRRGEIVKAILTVDKRKKFDRKAFDAFIAANLAKYKRPKIVEVANGDLPRNFLGKVIRRALR